MKNSPAAWSRFMDTTFGHLEGVSFHMDDLIVQGPMKEIHDRRFFEVMQLIEDNDLRVNGEKLKIGRKKVKFAGFIVSPDGMAPISSKIDAILQLPAPKDVTQVMTFLGMVGFYQAHLKNYSSIKEPIQRLIRKDVEWEWGKEQTEAFEKIKKMLSEAPALTIFDPKRKTIVETDASDYGIGAVLLQVVDGKKKPVAFASKTLSSAEKNYSTGEKEALACVWAIERWTFYLYGRHFQLITDHQSLKTMLKRGSKGIAPRRITRWFEKLLVYDFDAFYRKGKDNVTADCLSRLPLMQNQHFDTEGDKLLHITVAAITTEEAALDKEEIKISTSMSSDMTLLKQYITGGWPNSTKDVPKSL